MVLVLIGGHNGDDDRLISGSLYHDFPSDKLVVEVIVLPLDKMG